MASILLVRVEVVETSSQVWKTCILTAVLHSQILLHLSASDNLNQLYHITP